MAVLIQVIIALIVAGFVLWAARKVIALLPLEPIFKQIIDVLIVIVAVAIVIFYAVIPLLRLLAGISFHVTGLH